MRQYYSRRHFDRISNGGPDTAEQVAERIAWREVGQQAHKEALAKFGAVTQENAMDFARWQQERMIELIERWTRERQAPTTSYCSR